MQVFVFAEYTPVLDLANWASESKFPSLSPHKLSKLPINFDSSCGEDSGNLLCQLS